MTRLLTSALLLAQAPLLGASCQPAVECGPGTIEKNGECEPAELIATPASCGTGTYFDPGTGTCVSGVECDPATTVAETDEDTGITTCVGQGAADCASSLICPPAPAGKANVCGRFIDLATLAPIQTDSQKNDLCAAPTQGRACGLAIGFSDALLGNTLQLGSLEIDECGRFRATDIELPSSSFMAIGIDDHPGSGADGHVQGGVAFGAASGQTVKDVRVYAVSSETDQGWTSSAGDPAGLEGQTFAEKGVYVALFRYQDQPISGVAVLRGAEVATLAPTPASDTFYFAAADGKNAVTTIDTSATVTGPNGAALLINSPTPPQLHSGLGGEVGSCKWPIDPAAATPGVVFVQERHMVTDPATGEPCP